MKHQLIVMWAPPRSLSTAFLRVIAARGDFEVLHEPLCDLAACGQYSHRRENGDATVLLSIPDFLDHVDSLRNRGPVFVKDTCEFDYEADLVGSGYLREAQHVFMLRDPAKAINSHFAINPNLSSDEVGYRHLVKLYHQVKAESKAAPIFVEAERLAAAPQATIHAFCARTGLVYIPNSLEWEKGHLDIWQRTQRWHLDAANSTGIGHVAKQYDFTVDNHPPLQDLYRDNLPFYQYLKAEAGTDSGAVC